MRASSGRTVLVAGAGAGAGRQTALALAGRGDVVIAAGSDAEGGRSLISEIDAIGALGLFTQIDFSRPDEVEAMVGLAQGTFGPIDVAINDMGIADPWLCMQHEIAAMLAMGGGTIVNLASAGEVADLLDPVQDSISVSGVAEWTGPGVRECAKGGVSVHALYVAPEASPAVAASVLALLAEGMEQTRANGRDN